jgi:hypothetical protein
MRFVDEEFLLLVRGGRTPHALPSHQRERGDPRQLRLREELELLNRVMQPDRSHVPVRAIARLAATVAGVVRRGEQLDA